MGNEYDEVGREDMRTLAVLTKSIGVSAVFAFATPCQAAELEWKVGLAEVKITPERPVSLAGYASRNHPFEKVATHLYAKALSLEDRDGHVAVIMTTDLIGLTAAIAEPIWERLPAKTGLKREQILLI